MASAFGAGAGADMLQDVLRRKFAEQQAAAQQQFAQAKLAEEIRQANMQNDIQQGNLALGGRRIDQDAAELGFRKDRAGVDDTRYAEASPLRAAQLRNVLADAANAEGLGERTKAQQAFMSGENEKNRANAVRIANINGMNTLAGINARAQAAAGAKAPNADQQANEVNDTVALIDQIMSDPALSANVGPIDSRGLGFVRDPGGNARFTSLHDQLVGKMSLAQAGKLKGQGQISDKERAMLAAAATALNRGLEDPDYKNELTKIRDQFVRMQGGGQQVAHPGAGNGGPAVGTTKKFPNGKTGVWDGQGWVAQ